MNQEGTEGKPPGEQPGPGDETETSDQHAAANPRVHWRAYLDTARVTLVRLMSRGRQAARQGLQGDGYSPMDDLRAAFGHLNPPRIALALLGLGVVAYLLSGLYTVQPSEVADAFRDVASAREDEAEGYRNSVLPEARGRANRTLAEATSDATVQVDQATGAAQAFNAILAQYRADNQIYGEDVTRFRLYMEQMEKVLSRVQTYVVQRGERVNLRLLNGRRIATFPPTSGGQ
jgi:hypothetical protein